MMPGTHFLLTTNAALQNCSKVYGKDDMIFHNNFPIILGYYT